MIAKTNIGNRTAARATNSGNDMAAGTTDSENDMAAGTTDSENDMADGTTDGGNGMGNKMLTEKINRENGAVAGKGNIGKAAQPGKDKVERIPHDIKLIALDMDGTLLNEHGVLSEESRKTLECAMEQGIHVVIATGRVFSALPQDVLAVDGIEFAITSNGANLVRLKDRETLYSNLIDQEALEEIMDILSDPTIMIEVFFDHDVYAEKRCLNNLEEFGIISEKSKRYTLGTRTPVDSVVELIRSNEPSLENINLIFRDLDRRSEIWSRLEKMNSIMVTSSMPFNLEIGGATTSKADALAHLAGLLAVEQRQIMACGDSENDLEMLRFAGLSVAMKNAAQVVRQEADYITESNAEEGVARAIEKFAL